jgi:hypothetical protein
MFNRNFVLLDLQSPKSFPAQIYIEAPELAELGETAVRCGITSENDDAQYALLIRGEDSIQALYLSLKTINTLLDKLRDRYRLIWNDGSEMDSLLS